MNKQPINVARHLESGTSKHILLVTTGSYGEHPARPTIERTNGDTHPTIKFGIFLRMEVSY
jgi:hypothetical protein